MEGKFRQMVSGRDEGGQREGDHIFYINILINLTIYYG